MAPIPFRRSRKATRIARNLALAQAALALARSRVEATSGAAKGRGKLLLAGGALAGAGVVAFLTRGKLGRLLPSRTDDAAAPAAPAPPQQSNYDASGPVANTATPIPAPDPATPSAADPQESSPTGEPAPTRPAIDERAEEEAAAAEAAAIGGGPTAYAGVSPDEPAGEAGRPVAEAGGGEAEGQEQTEALLAENAVIRDQAPSDSERQIEDAIAAQDDPAAGETPEPLTPGPDRLQDGAEGVVTSSETEGGGISGRPGARIDDGAPETPGVPPTGSPATEPETGDR